MERILELVECVATKILQFILTIGINADGGSSFLVLINNNSQTTTTHHNHHHMKETKAKEEAELLTGAALRGTRGPPSTDFDFYLTWHP